MSQMHTDVIVSDGDLPAVGLVGDTVDLLDVVGVGEELIASDNVLFCQSVNPLQNATECALTL